MNLAQKLTLPVRLLIAIPYFILFQIGWGVVLISSPRTLGRGYRDWWNDLIWWTKYGWS
jgi:hypothetical protein